MFQIFIDIFLQKLLGYRVPKVKFHINLLISLIGILNEYFDIIIYKYISKTCLLDNLVIGNMILLFF